MKITFDEILASGELDRYLPAGGNDIDAQVCANGTCAHCGNRGAYYHPYEMVQVNGYISRRGFAECKKCGHTEEF